MEVDKKAQAVKKVLAAYHFGKTSAQVQRSSTTTPTTDRCFDVYTAQLQWLVMAPTPCSNPFPQWFVTKMHEMLTCSQSPATRFWTKLWDEDLTAI